MITLPIEELIGRAAELLRYDATAPLIFNSGLFLFLFVGFAGLYLLLRRATTLRILYVIAFLIKPMIIRPMAVPNIWRVTISGWRICGMKSLARTIGPATNCGKNER